MLLYKFFSSFKIDEVMNFLRRQDAREGYVPFPAHKIPVYSINIFKITFLKGNIYLFLLLKTFVFQTTPL